MKTATIRDVKHHLAKIEGWVRQGESVTVTKRGRPVFEISRPKKTTAAPKVDFRAMLDALWGKKSLSKKDAQKVWDSMRGERL